MTTQVENKIRIRKAADHILEGNSAHLSGVAVMPSVNDPHVNRPATRPGRSLNTHHSHGSRKVRHGHDRYRQKADGRGQCKADPILFLHGFRELTLFW